jgi:hypothetical protein
MGAGKGKTIARGGGVLETRLPFYFWQLLHMP